MINDVSVTYKGAMAFSFLALLAIGMCGFMYFQANGVDRLVERNLNQLSLAAETDKLSDEVHEANLSLKNFLLTGDREFVTEYEQHLALIDEKSKQLEGLYAAGSPEATAILGDVVAELTVWRTDIAGRQINLMRDPGTVELARVLELTGKGSRTLGRIETKIANIKESLGRQGAQAFDAQQSALSLMAMVSLGAAFLIAASAFVLGFLNHILAAIPLVNLSGVLTRLAEGDLEAKTDIDRNDEIGKIAKAVSVFRASALDNRRLQAEAESSRAAMERDRIAAQERAEAEAAERLKIATSGLAGGLRRLAEGDLSFRLEEAFAPDFEALRHDFNQSVSQLAEVLGSVTDSVEKMEAGSHDIASGVDDLSRRNEQQAASVEQTAAAVEELSVTVAGSAERTATARNIAAEATKSAEKSSEIVGQAEEAMQRIEDSSQKISKIISVIDEITFQTNLLALNAGVEAARAGEAGRGFAVVAQEVRELAQRSGNAAQEIKQLIGNSSSEVTTGVTLVRNASAALVSIGEYIHQINEQMEYISNSSREQSTGLSEVNTAVGSIDQATQRNAAMAEEANAAAGSLASEASKLKEMISRFRLASSSLDAARLRGMAQEMGYATHGDVSRNVA